MKVLDLFEVDEWSNVEATNRLDNRAHLRKKQLSACHRFVIMAKRVGFYTELSTIDFFKTLSRFSSTDVEDLRENIQEKIQTYSELLRYCDDMLNAKKNYERAGGKYERW